MIDIISKSVKAFNNMLPKLEEEVIFVNSRPYPDNISALLECYNMHSNKKIFRRISVISDYKLGFQGIKTSNVHALKSVGGLWLLLRSKYIICDNAILPTIISKRQIVFNVWHGLGLKKILFYCDHSQKMALYYASYAMAYSDFFSTVTEKAFGVSEDHVISSGAPRVDYFRFNDKNILLKVNKNANKYCKVIIWMPTYRQSDTAYSKNDGHDYCFGIPLLNKKNINVLNSCLLKNNILLIIKYHSLQNKQKSLGERYSNINILTNSDINKTQEALYKFIGVCDALITDYSSIYLEYLVLNRPICFAYDDMDEYLSKRGFMFEDVLSIMPGYHARNMDGLTEFINNIGQGKDIDVAQRKACIDKMGIYCDYKNSERFLKGIGFLVNE